MLQYACVQHNPNKNNIGCGERGNAIIIVALVFMIEI